MSWGEVEAKLNEMVEAGILTVRVTKAKNGRDVGFYSLANTALDHPGKVNDDADACDDDD